jgi:type II secretory ATPase GspE/PulE/Tfp pilus assembly ATPase PilB-like protein
LTSAFRKDPEVVMYPEIEDKEVMEILCGRVASDTKLIITAIRAKEAVEAMLRILLLKIPAKSFAPYVIGVLNQRLIRKLCEDCKEEYVPSPDMLKKLGIPAGRVDILYRPPEVDPDQPMCGTCGGIGYVGRTSIYELLVVDDTIREALINQPKLEVLRKVAREAGHRTLREEGALFVAQGITSVQELSRVLKG